MSKWKKVRLDKIADVRDGTHDTPKPVKSGKKLITSKHIKGGLLDKSSAYFISESEYEEVNKRSKVDQYDVLISMIGTIGEVYVEENTPNYAIKNLGLIKTGNRELSLWIKYLLNTWHGKNEIEKMKSGTTQQFISLSNLRKMKVLLPETKELINIVNVLSRYDELVKNNNRRIQILEQTAEELYKEWFVRMRFPGYEKTKFDKGIPEGWEVKKLKDFAILSYGKQLPTTELTDKGYEVFGGNGVIGYYSEYMYKEQKILISCRGAASGEIVVSNPYSYITNNSLILDTQENLFEYMKQNLFHRNLKPYATGSAQPQITIRNIENLKFLIPLSNTLENFNDTNRKISNKILYLKKKNKNLIKQRDLLLPRLMNGTIIVK